MNMLTDPLPDAVTVGGAACPIDTDFRTSIRFELLMQRGDLTDREKVARAMELYYHRAPWDARGACDALIWFYRCGRDEAGQEAGAYAEDGVSAKRVYDFGYDDGYIYAAFLGQYGIDLREIRYLHWWKFRALFWGLDEDCEFVKIMGYRSMKIPAKMPKEQKAFYRKMKRIHALPLPKDEKEKQDAITEALMNGGDLTGLV